MKRVMLWVLLALALPTAALASSVFFDTGFTSNALGNLSCSPNGGFFDLGVVGTGVTITFSGGTSPSQLIDACNIADGTVTVTNTSTGALVFQSNLGTGQVSSFFGIFGNGILEPSATIMGGSFDFFTINMAGFMGGEASVSATLVPEPNALEGLLLGTGMLGLAEMTRRRLRLGA